MAGNDDGQGVVSHRLACGARGVGRTGAVSKLTVAEGLASPNSPTGVPAALVELSSRGRRHIGEINIRTIEIAHQAARQIWQQSRIASRQVNQVPSVLAQPSRPEAPVIMLNDREGAGEGVEDAVSH